MAGGLWAIQDAVRVLVYTSKGLAWFGAVVVLSNGAKQTSKGLVFGAKQKCKQFASSKNY